jgi:ribonucleoside-triphosphate reductase
MTKKLTKVTRQKCEVYSRVVGYIRPISQWNPGKQSEYLDRTTFNSKC